MHECLMADILYRTGSIKFGEFVLSSGLRSHIYIDLRRILSFPLERSIVKSMLLALAVEIAPTIDVVVGVATGGIPWATIIAEEFSKPLAYVRSEKKRHGLTKIIEGIVNPNDRILLIDDVATTGNSIVSAIKSLEEVGVSPKLIKTIVIIDRGQGASKKLEVLGTSFSSIARLKDIIKCLADKGVINNALLRTLSQEADNIY